MPSVLISKQMISAHISDITKSKTTDPARFSRMVGSKSQQLGSLEDRITGIRQLCKEDWFVTAEPELSSDVLRFVEYMEAGNQVWSPLILGETR